MTSIIIPAFNESAVIARTLKSILTGAKPGEIEVIVVCNGCTDDTAEVAKAVNGPIRVIQTPVGKKTGALNLGDEAAVGFPRVYVDADVLITIDVIRAMADRLSPGDVLAVSPTAKVDLSGCSWAVRAVYEIRALLPSSREGIGGSGVYALSKAGRERFRDFPNVTADDGFVRIQFTPAERETLSSVQSIVFPPRRLSDLVVTKTRAHYGSLELAQEFPALWKNRGVANDQSLLKLFKFPSLWVKLIVYCAVTIIAKKRANERLRKRSFTWQRDETSRVAASHFGAR
ncbi:MAG: glycosyltransferase [Candidatus Acidiferrales bacterium]